MKKKLYFVILFSLLLTQAVSAQTSSPPVDFDLSEFHVMTAYASAPLLWQEGTSELVTVNVTMSDFRANNSEIYVEVIQFFVVEDTEGATPESGGTNTTDTVLTANSPGLQISQTIAAPRLADAFFLNISIYASPSGDGVNTETQIHSFRFPADTSIIVERDNLVPVVNLYGFPPWSFFQVWLPIYGVFLFSLMIPPLYIGAIKIKNIMSNAENEEQEENEEDIEE